MADITMPQLGETVTEGTITKWFKAVGDSVAEDEPLFEVSTDKVDSEVPSPVSGTLTEIKVQEGDTVDVGVVLAVIGDGGAAPAEAPAPGGRAGARARRRPRSPPPAAEAAPEPAPRPRRRARRRGDAGAGAAEPAPAPAPRARAGPARRVAAASSCRRSCGG